MSGGVYRVLPSVLADPARARVAPAYDTLTAALRDMGRGIVIDRGGDMVAFHESQLGFVDRGVGNWS